jgi:hypothetical protein
MNLKNILITLSIVAGLLFVITFYVVFYSGGGTYVVDSMSGSDSGIFSTSTILGVSSTTPSSTFAFASSSPTSTVSSSSSTSSASTPIGAAPVAWTQGNEAMSVTGASISGSSLTLDVQVVMGSAAECVPLDLRLIADENGDLAPPVTPQFAFPDTGTCNGTPGETYAGQQVVFTLADPATFPIILTTGGDANVLFEVNQKTDGSLAISLPPQTD